MRWASGVTRIRQRAVGCALAQGLAVELDADGADVVAEHAAELVVADLADIGALAAQRGDAGHGVAGGTARHLDPRTHPAVQLFRPVGIDQGHGAFFQAVGFNERIVGMGDHVDDGVADTDNVEGGLGHAGKYP